jgi:hypothetical protein
MGFGTTGVLIEENFTNEKINQNLEYYLQIWLYKLNYKNYTEFLFEVDLQLDLHSESKEIDVMTFANDFKQSQIEKNRFILWELISLNGMLEYFKKVIDFYDGEKFGLRNFITQFESDFEKFKNQKIIEFIELNLNNISIYNNRDFDYFRAEIKNFNKYQILYLHVLMYFDFIKIKDFLNSKFNHNYPIENYLKTKATAPEPQPDPQKNKINEKWFEAGLKLATGEAFEIYKENKNQKDYKSFNEITKLLKINIKQRPYISDTINNNKHKNIFKDKKKMKILFDYISENNLKFGENFLDAYNKIEFE